MWPLFLLEDDAGKEEIASMPGQARWGVGRLREALDGPYADGLSCVLLFGVLDDGAKKDNRASHADAPGGAVPRALAALRARYPRLTLMVDLCLCAYTDHGHCGVVRADALAPGGRAVDNDASVARLADVAVAYARAGAHVIAPSDMMDGRVAAIKAALARAGFGASVAVMAYSAKFASTFYGPFRDAAHSGMAFGDRSLYQLPPPSRALARRALARDIDEGADFVMVKPGLPYLDVLADARALVDGDAARAVPLAVYHVSGEYAALVAGARAGAFDLKRAALETMAAFRRAGADVVITYLAPQLLAWAKEDAATDAAARRADVEGEHW